MLITDEITDKMLKKYRIILKIEYVLDANTLSPSAFILLKDGYFLTIKNENWVNMENIIDKLVYNYIMKSRTDKINKIKERLQ